MSLQSIIVSFRPDLALTTDPSFRSFRAPWYAVGAVRSSRLHCQLISSPGRARVPFHEQVQQ